MNALNDPVESDGFPGLSPRNYEVISEGYPVRSAKLLKRILPYIAEKGCLLRVRKVGLSKNA